MTFESCYNSHKTILMEGALAERIKHEYNIKIDDTVALASLAYTNEGRSALQNLWSEYITIARSYNIPFMATTPTRRANKERVLKAGCDESIIKENVDMLKELQLKSGITMYIGGLMGCRGDAYTADEALTIEESKDFHSWQADLFLKEKVDFLFAGIMPSLSEVIGMAMAMEQTHLPYIISFMIRENGCLIDGTSIHDAIRAIDTATVRKPLCYMTNCVHPKILYKALSHDFNKTQLVRERFHGIQANTSPLTPEELDNSTDLKCSCSSDLAKETLLLKELIDLKIIGGCCGTDNTHIEAMVKKIETR